MTDRGLVHRGPLSRDGDRQPRRRPRIPGCGRSSASLVRHLHDFVKDVELTEDEWDKGIEFLTRTGQKCTDVRQEFILLSDVLGVSMLVETINHRALGHATEQTVLGPFHMVESPPRELGDTIALDDGGEPCLVTGRVGRRGRRPAGRGAAWTCGRPTPTASTTSSSPTSSRNATCAGCSPPTTRASSGSARSCRGTTRFPTTDRSGNCSRATGRHPNRPAHVHFIVTAPGHEPVTTHLFVDGTPYIDSDVVFGVKESLIREFPVVDDPERAARARVRQSFPHRAFRRDPAALRRSERRSRL